MTAGEANGGELIGKVLGGRYRVTATVGRGGMGVVARAVDELLNREVAVKILRAYTDASAPELADLRTRMQREAQAAARIRHSGVVTVHDVTEEQGLPVIVMELVDGPSLDDVLTERGTLEPREAAAIGAKLMDALDAAHRAGVLHRDVKPGNVLLERGERSEMGVPPAGGWGRVVLTDFGIASMEASDDDAMAKLTQSGQIVGSLDYLPPERAQGREPGPASDIWSLGMTLYAAVEGTSPFRRTSAWSTLAAIVTEPLPEPRRAGPLTPVLQALMAKEPESRPTADQAREMLERVAAGSTVNLAPPALIPTPTEAVVPTPPPGFGAAPALHQASPQPPHTGCAPPGQPHTVPHSGAPVAGRARGNRRSAAGSARRRSRTVVAAAAAAVVLAGGGITYALTGDHGGTSDDEAQAAPLGVSSPGGNAITGMNSPSASSSASSHAKPSGTPSQRPARGGDDDGKDGEDGEAGPTTTPSSDGGGAAPHSSASPTANPSAVYLSNDYSALCAGAGNKTTNGSKVIQWGCTNAQDERWVFKDTTDSNGKRAYFLQNAYSAKCMGPASSLANGAGVIQYTCNGAVDQKWWYDPGTHELRNVYSGKCLGLGSNATKGSQLIQWTCNGAADEKWSKTAR
ncbi:serine/threonine protein kinase [Streptomyces spiramyceticus]|uniref:serine/threonine protein kinase n=1 Tax=Streptomyces spiramyceticus TaxID=299717 RepID=UPI00237AC805|nr:protein kinase [Streptomyces spiramyceticus]